MFLARWWRFPDVWDVFIISGSTTETDVSDVWISVSLVSLLCWLCVVTRLWCFISVSRALLTYFISRQGCPAVLVGSSRYTETEAKNCTLDTCYWRERFTLIFQALGLLLHLKFGHTRALQYRHTKKDFGPIDRSTLKFCALFALSNHGKLLMGNQLRRRCFWNNAATSEPGE